MGSRRAGLHLFALGWAASLCNSHLFQCCHRAFCTLSSALLLLMPAVLPLLLLPLLRPVQAPGLSCGAGFIHQRRDVFIPLLRKLHQHLHSMIEVAKVLLMLSSSWEAMYAQGMQGQGQLRQGMQKQGVQVYSMLRDAVRGGYHHQCLEVQPELCVAKAVLLYRECIEGGMGANCLVLPQKMCDVM